MGQIHKSLETIKQEHNKVTNNRHKYYHNLSNGILLSLTVAILSVSCHDEILSLE